MDKRLLTNPMIGTGLKTLSKLNDGSSTAILELTNDSHVIPCDEYGKNGNYDTCETTVNFYIGNQLDASATIDPPKVGLGISSQDYTWNPISRTFKLNNMNNEESYVDFSKTYGGTKYTVRFSISKVRNGNGSFLMDLTNDNHTFVSNADGYIANPSTIRTEVLVYKGTKAMKISKLDPPSSKPKGLDYRVVSNNILEITALKGKDLATTGTLTIKAEVKDGTDEQKTTIYLKKDFSWSKTKDGNGVNTLTEYYLGSRNSVGVSSPPITTLPDDFDGWDTDVPTLNNEDKKYLWNFERLVYNTGKIEHTPAAMIGSYSEDGNGISKIENYYIVSKSNKAQDLPDIKNNIGSGEPSDTGKKWTLDVQTLTPELKYLWNIEKVSYTKKDPYFTEPAMTGAYGDKGETGPAGEQGPDGVGYTIVIGGGVREITYAATGKNPEPSTLNNYTLEFYNNGKKIQEPGYIKWTCGGNIITSGADNQIIFSPQLSKEYKKGVESYIAVNVRETIDSVEVSHKIPISCTKHAGGLDWIEDWDSNKTEVTDKRIVSPRIFAGVGGADPTGVAIGKNIFGEKGPYSHITGIAGYKKGTKTFHLDENGDLFIGGHRDGSYLRFNENGFDLRVSKFNIGSVNMSDTPKSVDVMYYSSTSNTELKGGEWQTNAPTWTEGRFIWTKTVTHFIGGKKTETTPSCIAGTRVSSDGRGIASIQEQYYLSTSRTELLGGAWLNSPPKLESGKYVWTRSIINYTSGEPDRLDPICTTGEQGEGGKTGNGIMKIVEYYAISSSSSTPPSGWQTTVLTPTESNKYLWNYEDIHYTDGTIVPTKKRVIGTFSKNGLNGDPGKDGKGIASIVNKYLATSAKSGVTTSTGGWTTSIQAMTPTNKYLWNYEIINYTVGPAMTSTPCIIGVYGDTGLKGDRGPEGPTVPWVKAWTSNTTGISDSSICSPRIFAGTGGSQMTGVALGKDVFGTTGSFARLSGLAGYKKGKKTFHLDENGDLLIGDRQSGRFMSFNGSKFELCADEITFSSTKQTVQDTIKNEVNNINIGGTNLIINSNKFVSGSGASGITSSVVGEELKIISGQSNGNWFTNFIKDSNSNTTKMEGKLNEGDTFTFSMTIKADRVTKPPTVYFKSGMGYFPMTGSVTTSYSKVYYTGTWKKSGGNIQLHLGFSGLNAIFFIKNIKLEKGNKPTDWSPAIEDSDEVVNKLNQKVEQLDKDKANTSTVNGQISNINGTINSISNRVDSNGKTISSVQQSITPEQIVSKVETGIKGNSSITTNTMIFNKNGLTLNGGGFVINDSSGRNKSFSINSNGEVVAANGSVVLARDGIKIKEAGTSSTRKDKVILNQNGISILDNNGKSVFEYRTSVIDGTPANNLKVIGAFETNEYNQARVRMEKGSIIGYEKNAWARPAFVGGLRQINDISGVPEATPSAYSPFFSAGCGDAITPDNSGRMIFSAYKNDVNSKYRSLRGYIGYDRRNGAITSNNPQVITGRIWFFDTGAIEITSNNRTTGYADHRGISLTEWGQIRGARGNESLGGNASADKGGKAYWSAGYYHDLYAKRTHTLYNAGDFLEALDDKDTPQKRLLSLPSSEEIVEYINSIQIGLYNDSSNENKCSRSIESLSLKPLISSKALKKSLGKVENLLFTQELEEEEENISLDIMTYINMIVITLQNTIKQNTLLKQEIEEIKLKLN